MTQVNITVPLPGPVVEFYDKEAKRRTKTRRRFVSRAAVMRDVLEAHVAEHHQCPPIPSAKTP